MAEEFFDENKVINLPSVYFYGKTETLIFEEVTDMLSKIEDVIKNYDKKELIRAHLLCENLHEEENY